MLKFGNEKHIGVGSGGDAEWGYIEGTLSDQTDLNTALNGKQSTLISGTNIKTINGVSVLGEGDIEVGEGGTITVNQSYDATSTYAQSGTAVAEAISTKANTSLNNLSSDGQMIVDSANGTISNCVLEIPQNIKLTLENNVLTLKSGSVLTDSGATYQTITIMSDKTSTISTGSNNRWIIFATRSGVLAPVVASACVSGATDSLAGRPIHIWFDTTNQEVLYYGSDGTTSSHRTYPVCIIDVDREGNVSFAKNSNGNDMIFNGAGFIGHHAVIYPNIKGLAPDGFNEDGSLKNLEWTNNALRIIEMPSYNSTNRNIYYSISTNNLYDQMFGADVDNIEDMSGDNWIIQYVKNKNQYYRYKSGVLDNIKIIRIALFLKGQGEQIDNFTIRQPVRTATTEMLDKKQDTLTFDTTPTSASTNPVTSGGVYTALSGKQADITTIIGYDATKTQTLKNVSGVLTWVDDGE